MTEAKQHRRITITDIAHMAQTSKTTVSFFLNGKTERMSEATKERIREAIKKTGYAPSPVARGMNAKHSHLIGVIIGDITNSFANRLVQGVAEAAERRDYSLLVCSSNFNRHAELNYIDRLLAVGVDGFIVQPTAQSMEVTKAIEQAGKSLVFLDSNLYGANSYWVKTDNYNSSYRAVCSCIEAGYEKFGIICATPGLITSRIERFGGFMEAVQESGKEFEQFEFNGDQVDQKAVGDFLHRVIDGKTPTLIFVPNCWALPDIYTAMSPYYKLMPNTVGLLGFDNIEWIKLASPSVSAVIQPAHEEGRIACDLLVDSIEHRDIKEAHQILQCDTWWEDSTKYVDPSLVSL